MTLLELCEMQHRALLVRGCLCVWSAPYDGMSTKRELIHQCARCKSVEIYEAMQKEPNG